MDTYQVSIIAPNTDSALEQLEKFVEGINGATNLRVARAKLVSEELKTWGYAGYYDLPSED